MTPQASSIKPRAPIAPSFGQIVFEDDDLGQSISDAAIETDLPDSSQKAVAAYSMVAFGLAMAVKDEVQFRSALDGLQGAPSEIAEVSFFSQYGAILAREIINEFSTDDSDMTVFERRAKNIVSQVCGT